MCIRLVVLVFAWIASRALLAPADEPKLNYNRDIRPILSEKCFTCHGFNEKSRQAELRLDMPESAYADRDGKKPIVPGDAEHSEVWRRISSTDEAEVMPPPDSHKVLLAGEKSLLKRWIDEGAPYAKHWSFIPPERAPLPGISNSAWPRNEIDRFVLAKLDAEKLQPSAEADRRTLIRRLSLDLTGLPPSAEEVEAFVADDNEHAYENLVDRLLANPHFGERMAIDWLDAARYADTNGFSIDGGRHMWLWRDWVIDAFNRNLPYDQFLVQQLAGDLLPNATEAQLIASGFQRNNMVTHEGGTIPEENLTNYNVDRVKTLGEAVLGLTLACAQCHDHKYDPLTQRDYYQLFAYFNTLSDVGSDGDGGRNPRPMLEARTVLQADGVPKLQEQIATIKAKLAKPDAAVIAAWEAEQQAELNARGKDLELHPVELIKVSTPNVGKGFEIEEGRFVRITSPAGLVAYDVSLQLPQVRRPITGLRIVFHRAEGTPAGGYGFGTISDPPPSPEGTFILTSFSASAESVPGDQVNLNRLIDVLRATADCWNSNFRPEGVLDTGISGWSPEAGHEGTTQVTVTFDKPLNASETPFLTAQLNFGYGRQLVAAKFEIFAVTGADDGSPLPKDIIAIIQAMPEQRSAEQREQLRAYFATHSPATLPLRTSLANLEEHLRALTEKFSTMVMDQANKPRETRILNRGDYSQPMEKVNAGTPAVLPQPPGGTPTNRLGLAQWTVMRSNPLTARVAVNRFWQSLFGYGIVHTAADFGAQGEYPSHPELLDWLAVDFMDRGWDVKALVRTIVTSATYRQSSAASTELLERDPANRLLARGPRFRLPAELVRDSALKVSGLLVPWLGGPSVNPYSPGDLWREISHYGSSPATAQTFIQDHGEKLYRRSLYTYWKRTVPPPNMVAFDAPNREVCVVARPSTTTPLQALVMLNDVQFVEAARAFAERIVNHTTDDSERLKWAFEECVSRPPTDQERAVMQHALTRERTRYQADEAAARAFLANGESARDVRIPVAEHAAWSQVASLLLNLSETVTRN